MCDWLVNSDQLCLPQQRYYSLSFCNWKVQVIMSFFVYENDFVYFICMCSWRVINFYPRDAMLARVIVIATCLSVRPSVRPSVTRRYRVKTKKASVMISSPSRSPKTLVFWRQISSPNSKGFPPNGGLKEGSVGKIQRFSTFKLQYLENGSRYGQSYY